MHAPISLFAISLAMGAIQGPRPTDASPVPPSSVPVVEVGDSLVDGRRIREDSIANHMVLFGMGAPRDVGTMTRVIRLTAIDGRPAMLSVQAFAGGVVDSSYFDPPTLRPLRLRSRNPSRALALDFDSTRVNIQSTPAEEAKTSSVKELRRRVFDASIADLVFASLPLTQGFFVRIPVYTYESGGLVWYPVRVTGTESVTGSGGAKTVAWALELRTPERIIRYWIARDSRRVVKTEYDLGGQRRLTITAP